MLARFIVDVDGPGGPLHVGAILDHPDAWRQVLLGNAEPIDDACRTRALLAGWAPPATPAPAAAPPVAAAPAAPAVEPTTPPDDDDDEQTDPYDK